MMDKTADQVLAEIAAAIEIPESAYETAEARYQDLGRWFGRSESLCARYAPHISVQGSFRLGTVNRPLNGDETYDLDLVCNLERGVHKAMISQEELKRLVGQDIESYRLVRRIEEDKKEKHRCWRLEYADQMRFHMDILPCIPYDPERRILLREAMMRAGASEALAKTVADLSVSITDDRHHFYHVISNEWLISNPIGFARWFESRMRLATLLLEKRLVEARVARIDDLPAFRWKTPLQRAIQLLKRHRDIFFAGHGELKPASNILTTLAGLAYQGESGLAETLTRCLDEMDRLVNTNVPRVANPVNPAEDFADKWTTSDGRAKRLEEWFWNWLAQAKADFKSIRTSSDTEFIVEQALKKLAVRLDSRELLAKVGFATPIVRQTPRVQTVIERPARPWRR
jgi:hypothetical protein